VPKERAWLYLGMFLLSAITAAVSNLAYFGGSGLQFLFYFFPPEMAMSQFEADYSVTGATSRIVGLSMAAQGIWCWLLARHGAAGILEFQKPWRFLLLGATVFAGLLGGFRSVFLFFLMVFFLLLWFERLWRSARVMITMLVLLVLTGASLLLFSDHLPKSAQRALSFLPIKIDYATRQDAEGSTEWRVEMWKQVLPDVPRYLWCGKGYSLDPKDLYLAEESIQRGFASGFEIAILAGDYHNGPLSVLIPFGIWGTAAFAWFLVSCLRMLRQHLRYGDPGLLRINQFLFALFLAKIIFFLTVFGSLFSDLFQFTGLAGLSLSLNGGLSKPPPPARDNGSSPTAQPLLSAP
jgi:hypothetical protein